MTSRNGNFQDPVGLVMRMIASGNRAAYSALAREAMRFGALPIDLVMSPFEKRRHRYSDVERPVVLVVGAPRSGTTLVYQALSRFLRVTYPSNCSAMFPRSPITATKIQERIRLRRKPRFRSFYGQTCRLTDSNDAFEIWNRWLGDDRYRPAQSLSEKKIQEMRSFFGAWTTALGKPFLNKNNRNTLAIRVLSNALPNAVFVVVRRNPLMVAQSLITARRRIQGDARAGWGLQAETVDSHSPLGHVDAVCQQLFSIESEMEAQLDAVDCNRVFRMTYEGFCERPSGMIRSISEKFAGVDVDETSGVDDCEPFRVSNRQQVSDAEFRRIKQVLTANRCDDTRSAVE